MHSDPVEQPFVSDADAGRFAGRNLAISVAVDGATGPASYHGSAFTTS